MIRVKKVIGFQCPNKYILMYDGEPLIVLNSKKSASQCVQFIDGYLEEKDINEKKVLGVLKKIRKLQKGESQ